MPGLRPDVVDALRRSVGITLQFELDLVARLAASRRCRRRSTPLRTCCPNDLPQPPIYSKVNPADAPI
jgi:multidrug efflux pump